MWNAENKKRRRAQGAPRQVEGFGQGIEETYKSLSRYALCAWRYAISSKK
ncbi:MAG: hypothetical protein JRE36_12590 [Deltaproteobacteria bacterium]|nr:hypothetical protein [Deltaproteobacteria bacterium]